MTPRRILLPYNAANLPRFMPLRTVGQALAELDMRLVVTRQGLQIEAPELQPADAVSPAKPEASDLHALTREIELIGRNARNLVRWRAKKAAAAQKFWPADEAES